MFKASLILVSVFFLSNGCNDNKLEDKKNELTASQLDSQQKSAILESVQKAIQSSIVHDGKTWYFFETAQANIDQAGQQCKLLGLSFPSLAALESAKANIEIEKLSYLDGKRAVFVVEDYVSGGKTEIGATAINSVCIK